MLTGRRDVGWVMCGSSGHRGGGGGGWVSKGGRGWVSEGGGFGALFTLWSLKARTH